MAESTLIGHEQCPRCKASGRDRHADNLGTYSDGHKYCFSCGYTLNRHGTAFLPIHPPEKSERPITLPADADPFIPANPAGLWLQKYDITFEEVKQNNILWSPSRHLLIFPFYGSGAKNLLGWQGRYLGEGVDNPKYFSFGRMDEIFNYIGLQFVEGSGIIVVEDMLSAIKIGRIACALPLFGSHVPPIKRRNMMFQSGRLTLWLDYDKAATSYTMANEIRLLGYETRSVITTKDPKELNDDEIEEIVYAS